MDSCKCHEDLLVDTKKWHEDLVVDSCKCHEDVAEKACVITGWRLIHLCEGFFGDGGFPVAHPGLVSVF